VLQRTQYVYDSVMPNETPSQTTKRKYAELLKEKTAYEEIYRILQTLSQAESAEVYKRIREGADVEGLLRQIQEGDLLYTALSETGDTLSLPIPIHG
jgi:hypothetical protein